MIGYLRGVARTSQLVDVAGVGYVVHTPTPLPAGDTVELHVTTVVREDAITLYGFTTETEQTVFQALTKITGVGPAHALNLLGQLGVDGIANAVANKDEKTLQSVKGIGSRLATAIASLAVLPDGLGAGTDPRAHEIASALTGLGFDKSTATVAAASAVAGNPTGTVDELLPAALTVAAGGHT